MSQKLTKEYVKKVIFDAFKDVPKGDGLGARECGANDDYIYGEEAKKFRDQDVEQHWWEYPKELIEKGVLDYCLTYNNNDGIKFYLPAVMTADVEGISGYTDFEISIFGTLCEPYTEIHKYHREYVAYIKSIDISKIIKQYNFNSAQIHAIAIYLLYDMHMNNFHNQFFSSRDEIITGAKKDVKRSHDPKNYTLTLEDAVAIVDEEHRIVRDWFKAGGVEVNDYVFEEADSEDRFLAKWNKNKAEILKDKLDLSIEELKKIIQDQNLTIHDVMWLASQLDNPDQQVKIYRTVMTLSIPSKDSGINLERASYLQAPNNASVLLFNKGDYKGALEVIEPFLKYTPENPYIGHSGACALVKVGRLEEALEQVRLAVENGYDHIEKIRIDKDLETLFDGNRFKEIFRKYDEEYPTLKDITKKDLEVIRAATIDFYMNAKHEHKDAFIKELQNGGLFIGDEALRKGKFVDPVLDVNIKDGRIQDGNIRVLGGDEIGIGMWKLENTDNGFRLIRYGNRFSGAMMIFNFGVNLKKDETGWSVIDDFYEHQRITPE